MRILTTFTRSLFQNSLSKRDLFFKSNSHCPLCTTHRTLGKIAQSNVESKSIPQRKRFRLRWIFIGGAVVYGVYLLAPKPREFTDPLHYYSNWKIRAYTSLPLNFLSHFAGRLSLLEIPIAWRSKFYGFFADTYGIRMDEAVEESLEAYPTLASLFNRELKLSVRPISACQLISPVDGTVLHFGEIIDHRINSVKEQDYEITDFLGPVKIETKPANKLYQIVIYLAPGDYHSFHSPGKWDVNEKIHHPGFLLSVNPRIFEYVPNLLAINERVALCGRWLHGFFSMTAVAATNVGDIVIGTSSHKSKERLRYRTKVHEVFDEQYSYKKGEKVGEFRAGSTVVLIFEAPPKLQFAIKAGDVLKFGQSLVVKDV